MLVKGGAAPLLGLIFCITLLPSQAREFRGRKSNNNGEKAAIIPDTATIDSEALTAAHADKFLSLWFIFVLGGPTEITDQPYTLLVPLNTGLPGPGTSGFLTNKTKTKTLLLNHVILGRSVDPDVALPSEALKTASGTSVSFTESNGNVFVNGIKVTKEKITVEGGSILILESFLDVDTEASSATEAQQVEITTTAAVATSTKRRRLLFRPTTEATRASTSQRRRQRPTTRPSTTTTEEPTTERRKPGRSRFFRAKATTQAPKTTTEIPSTTTEPPTTKEKARVLENKFLKKATDDGKRKVRPSPLFKSSRPSPLFKSSRHKTTEETKAGTASTRFDKFKESMKSKEKSVSATPQQENKFKVETTTATFTESTTIPSTESTTIPTTILVTTPAPPPSTTQTTTSTTTQPPSPTPDIFALFSAALASTSASQDNDTPAVTEPSQPTTAETLTSTQKDSASILESLLSTTFVEESFSATTKVPTSISDLTPSTTETPTSTMSVKEQGILAAFEQFVKSTQSKQTTVPPPAPSFLTEFSQVELDNLPEKEIRQRAAEVLEESEIESLVHNGFAVTQDDSEFLAWLKKEIKDRKQLGGSQFLNHLIESGVAKSLKPGKQYTALVPTDEAFYAYYPIDYGFNIFNVASFVKRTMQEHLLEGNVPLEMLPDGSVLTTLAGTSITVNKRNGGVVVSGVPVMRESEVTGRYGRIYSLDRLLHVDRQTVSHLRALHPHLESGPLMGPWFHSQFLSHLYHRTSSEEQEGGSTDIFAQYLNLSQISHLLPSYDETSGHVEYTALVPSDEAFRQFMPTIGGQNMLLEDSERRNRFIGRHILKGRLSLTELQGRRDVTTITGETLPVLALEDGSVVIGGSKVTSPSSSIYNLGSMYSVDRPLVGGETAAMTSEAPLVVTRTEVSVSKQVNAGSRVSVP